MFIIGAMGVGWDREELMLHRWMEVEEESVFLRRIRFVCCRVRGDGGEGIVGRKVDFAEAEDSWFEVVEKELNFCKLITIIVEVAVPVDDGERG